MGGLKKKGYLMPNAEQKRQSLSSNVEVESSLYESSNDSVISIGLLGIGKKITNTIISTFFRKTHT